MPESSVLFTGSGRRNSGGCSGNPSAPDYGRILDTPKPGWRGFPMLERLFSGLGRSLPTLFDTDVKAAAPGEAAHGAARGLDHAAYVTVGAGIGGGVVRQPGLLPRAAAAFQRLVRLLLAPAAGGGIPVPRRTGPGRRNGRHPDQGRRLGLKTGLTLPKSRGGRARRGGRAHFRQNRGGSMDLSSNSRCGFSPTVAARLRHPCMAGSAVPSDWPVPPTPPNRRMSSGACASPPSFWSNSNRRHRRHRRQAPPA